MKFTHFAYGSIVILIFMVGLSLAQTEANANSLPNGFVTSNQLQLANSSVVPGDCPDGTPSDDYIICIADPPVGTNPDTVISGNAGTDGITVNQDVTVSRVGGDEIPDDLGLSPIANGFADQITNHGIVTEAIVGDGVTEQGGNDYIINRGYALQIYGDGLARNGGNDWITNVGEALVIYGDWVTEYGGHDIFALSGTTGYVSGDGVFVYAEFVPEEGTIYYGGNDQYWLDGTINGAVFGDEMVFIEPSEPGNYPTAYLRGGNDYIVNSGTIAIDPGNSDDSSGSIFGDGLADPNSFGGSDTIRNAGTIEGSIYGDYIDDGNGIWDNPTGAGAWDDIRNSGTVGGSIYAEGGNDIVTMMSGANGGADNSLTIYGGDGFDTLRFEYFVLDQAIVNAINSADPTSGSVVIDDQTFIWLDFEALEAFNGTAPTATMTSSPTTTPPQSTVTASVTSSPQPPTNTASPTYTRTATPSPGPSSTPTPTFTPSSTNSVTPTRTSTSTALPPTNTATPTTVLVLPVQPSGLTTSGSLTTPPVQPTYTWNHNQQTTWYLVQINRGSTMIFQTWYQVGVSINCSTTCSITPTTSLANGSYTWWVQGWNTLGTGAWSNGATFTVNLPAPTVPTGLTTSGSLTTPPVRPTYTWTHDPNSTWYQLYVSNASGVVLQTWYEVGVGITCTSTCNIQPMTTLSNGNYNWWVQGWNGVGTSAWSGTANFTVNAPAPITPTGLTTSGSLTTSPVRPTYIWTHDPNTSWYQLYVSNASGIIIQMWYEVGVSITCSSTCSITPSVTLANGNYNWWVQGWNSVGTSAWSATANFTVAVPAPLQPTGLNTTGTANQPTYTWTHDPNTTWYQIQVNGPSGVALQTWYQVGVGISCASTCSITPSTILANGSYTWWVQGYNTVGNGAWSAGVTFNVP